MREPGVPRLYTLAEANEALLWIRPVLVDLQKYAADLNTIQKKLAGLPDNAWLNGEAQATLTLEQRAQQLANEATVLVQRLTAEGVEVKDPATGLIDFRSLRDGQVVYLCWRLGEESIGFWHELDAGFQGRQPL